MKKIILFLSLIVLISPAFGQKDQKPTAAVTIKGEVKNPVVIQIADLKKWTVQNIGDVVITNHLGEKKSEAKGLKGVLLKEVLESVAINAENPKVLSEYYFVCKANDGYTVVYSWNELFNTATGKSAYLITEKAGKPAAEMNDAILMISTADNATGRRQLKALDTIEVKRAK